jgi:O-antigen ligase
MSASVETRVTGGRKAELALTTLLFLAPLATAAAPRLTWLFLLLVAGGLLLGAWRRTGDWRQLFQPHPVFMAALAVVLYAFLSAAWSPDPGGTLGKAALLLGAVLLTFAGGNAAAAWDKAELRRASLAFALGALLGALYILAGILTRDSLRRAAESVVTLLSPDSGAPASTKFKPEFLRRSVTMLVLHLWPALLAVTALVRPSRRLAFTLLVFAAVSIPVFFSGRESAQLALVGSVLAFVLASVWRRGMPRLLAAAWCLAFVAVLPLTLSAYQAEWHMEESLPKSARARVILWGHTAERVFENPWIGVGADATAEITKRSVADQPKGYIAPRTTGPHAHNLFLQIWFELGLVGAVLAAIAGAAIALRIASLSPEVRPFAAATFATFGISVAFAWGIWQTWLICGVALAALYLLVTARAAGPGGEADRQPGNSSG